MPDFFPLAQQESCQNPSPHLSPILSGATARQACQQSRLSLPENLSNRTMTLTSARVCQAARAARALPRQDTVKGRSADAPFDIAFRQHGTGAGCLRRITGCGYPAVAPRGNPLQELLTHRDQEPGGLEWLPEDGTYLHHDFLRSCIRPGGPSLAVSLVRTVAQPTWGNTMMRE